MPTAVGRELWMYTYAGMAMQSLIQQPGFRPDDGRDIDNLARRAVAIAKAVVEQLEATRETWIDANDN